MRRMTSAVALAAIVLASDASHAGEISRFEPVRMVAYRGGDRDPAPFIGVRHAGFEQYALSAPDAHCSDRFRDDALVIWSSSTQSPWHLLPPKPLGRLHKAEAR